MVGVLAVLTTSEAVFAAAPPAWVKQLAAVETAGASAPAVILLDQVDITIGADGRMRSVRRYAVRIRDRAGRDAAALRAVYLTDTGKVREIRGWVVRHGGGVRELGSRDAVDVALVNNDVFNEVRVRALGALEDVEAGDLFAAEVESEDRLLFAQLEWQMQAPWPAREILRTVTIPAGWRVTAQSFNASFLEPQRIGQTTTWRMRDVPALPDEEAMPPVTDVAARLAISIFGASGAPAPGEFESWEQVSAWLHRLADDGGQVPDRVAAKATELAGSARTDFDKVDAIARFVQRIQYISIQTGLGRGGGYQPRPPATTLERSYGDCKDKASLMRAMLASIGIKSYLMSIYSGDRNYVREAWPSPQQFNHAVIGVALARLPADAMSRVHHPAFGTLMVFDPTDEHTPLGQLPLHEQGSLALVVSPASGALLRMPVSPLSSHAIERTIEGELRSNGMLSATLREHFSGARGVATRASYVGLGPGPFRATVERRIEAAVPRVQIRSVLVENKSATAFTMVTTVEATAYAQSQAGLFLFPMPFHVDGHLELPAAPFRRTAVHMEPSVVRETVRLKVPPGFAVDELPPPVNLETAFGRYSRTLSVDGAHVVAKRTLEVPMQTIPADQYAIARSFFTRVRAADSAPAVLVRKP